MDNNKNMRYKNIALINFEISRLPKPLQKQLKMCYIEKEEWVSVTTKEMLEKHHDKLIKNGFKKCEYTTDVFECMVYEKNITDDCKFKIMPDNIEMLRV